MERLLLVYRELLAGHDPAGDWRAAGAPDQRFSDQAPSGSVVRAPTDLQELHQAVADLFGPDVWPAPPPVAGELRQVTIPLARPALLMPLVEGLRVQLEHRGPAFWTWKSAREALAHRVAKAGTVTAAAVLVGAPGNNTGSVTPH